MFPEIRRKLSKKGGVTPAPFSSPSVSAVREVGVPKDFRNKILKKSKIQGIIAKTGANNLHKSVKMEGRKKL